MTYLLDTDWLIDYLSGKPAAMSLIGSLLPDRLAISVVTYAEVYEGIYHGQNPRYFEEAFLEFLSVTRLLYLTEDIARVWASTRGSLRRSGQLIPAADLFIAATALHYDLILVSRNGRHFERIPNLRLLSGPGQ